MCMYALTCLCTCVEELMNVDLPCLAFGATCDYSGCLLRTCLCLLCLRRVHLSDWACISVRSCTSVCRRLFVSLCLRLCGYADMCLCLTLCVCSLCLAHSASVLYVWLCVCSLCLGHLAKSSYLCASLCASRPLFHGSPFLSFAFPLR